MRHQNFTRWPLLLNKLVACGVAFFYDNRQTFSAVSVILQYYINTALQFSIIKGSCLLIDLSTMLVSSSLLAIRDGPSMLPFSFSFPLFQPNYHWKVFHQLISLKSLYKIENELVCGWLSKVIHLYNWVLPCYALIGVKNLSFHLLLVTFSFVLIGCCGFTTQSNSKLYFVTL